MLRCKTLQIGKYPWIPMRAMMGDIPPKGHCHGY